MLRTVLNFNFWKILKSLPLLTSIAIITAEATAATIDCSADTNTLACYVINDDQNGVINGFDLYGLTGDIGTETDLLITSIDFSPFWSPDFDFYFPYNINQSGHLSVSAVFEPSLIYYNNSRLFSIHYNQTIDGLPLTLHEATVENDFYGTINTTYLAPGIVPIPAAAWLFGSGLIALISIARSQRRI